MSMGEGSGSKPSARRRLQLPVSPGDYPDFSTGDGPNVVVLEEVVSGSIAFEGPISDRVLQDLEDVMKEVLQDIANVGIALTGGSNSGVSSARTARYGYMILPESGDAYKAMGLIIESMSGRRPRMLANVQREMLVVGLPVADADTSAWTLSMDGPTMELRMVRKNVVVATTTFGQFYGAGVAGVGGLLSSSAAPDSGEAGEGAGTNSGFQPGDTGAGGSEGGTGSSRGGSSGYSVGVGSGRGQGGSNGDGSVDSSQDSPISVGVIAGIIGGVMVALLVAISVHLVYMVPRKSPGPSAARVFTAPGPGVAAMCAEPWSVEVGGSAGLHKQSRVVPLSAAASPATASPELRLAAYEESGGHATASRMGAANGV
eukprot:CAMPEP_0170613074 /NCGR_PEP_ID=MMETSP0224-20130122/24074_1 /TAXON_ID=285029 /ORGANISM="Togula jolla, Strain CCCM 725" /LENGTH=371 /DNA_ID=CAMNT_0010938643 /DNA_START=78 /DNA_END=1193 /DNA_ORIENTATION=-